MKLYAMDVVLTMTHSHYLAIVRHGCHLKAFWHRIFCYHPTVIASHHDTFGQTFEDVVVAQLRSLGLHSVIHFFKIFKTRTEHFAYSLMSETHAKYRFASCVCAYHVEQQACF